MHPRADAQGPRRRGLRAPQWRSRNRCAASIAIKNGWFPREDEDRNWHVACVAIGDTWVVSVLQRYPITAGWDPDFAHVRKVCQDVTTQLLNPEAT